MRSLQRVTSHVSAVRACSPIFEQRLESHEILIQHSLGILSEDCGAGMADGARQRRVGKLDVDSRSALRLGVELHGARVGDPRALNGCPPEATVLLAHSFHRFPSGRARPPARAPSSASVHHLGVAHR
jgi:hypothetical protein